MTVNVPATKQETVTAHSTVVADVPGSTVYNSTPLPPTTVVLPTTVTRSPTPGTPTPSSTRTSATTSAVATAGAERVGPAVALLAGFVGAVVLL